MTGAGVLALLESYKNTVLESAKALKLNNPAELPARCTVMTAQLKDAEKQVEQLRQKMAGGVIDTLFENAKEVCGVQIVSAMLNGAAPDMLRKLGDQVKSMDRAIIAVFAGVNDDKGTFYCVCTKSAVEAGAHAGKIVQRVAAITGGKGGGRPDNAMAGIGKNYMVDEALLSLESIAGDVLAH